MIVACVDFTGLNAVILASCHKPFVSAHSTHALHTLVPVYIVPPWFYNCPSVWCQERHGASIPPTEQWYIEMAFGGDARIFLLVSWRGARPGPPAPPPAGQADHTDQADHADHAPGSGFVRGNVERRVRRSAGAGSSDRPAGTRQAGCPQSTPRLLCLSFVSVVPSPPPLIRYSRPWKRQALMTQHEDATITLTPAQSVVSGNGPGRGGIGGRSIDSARAPTSHDRRCGPSPPSSIIRPDCVSIFCRRKVNIRLIIVGRLG